MFGAIFRPLVASRWRRAALVGVTAAAAVAGTWLCRGGLPHRATVLSLPAAQAQPGQGFVVDEEDAQGCCHNGTRIRKEKRCSVDSMSKRAATSCISFRR